MLKERVNLSFFLPLWYNMPLKGANIMKEIAKLSEHEFSDIQKLCLSLSEKANLTDRIKAFLEEDDQVIIDKLETGKKVYFKEFDRMIKNYFDALDFCSSEYDSELLMGAKNDITSLFTYLDSLNLDGEFTSIFVYHFFKRIGHFERDESGALYDLLISAEIRNSKMMVDYICSDTTLSYDLVNFTKSLYIMYEFLNEEEREKLKYIFHSSLSLLNYFINYYNDLDTYFNSKVLSSFSKEALGHIFRYKGFRDYIEFFEAEDYFLKVIGSMGEYVFEKTGHYGEFFSNVLDNYGSIARQRLLNKLFKEYYDNYYETSLKNGFDDDIVFHELLDLILNAKRIQSCYVNKIDTLDKLFKEKIKDFDQLYIEAFNKRALLNMKHKTFNPKKDLKHYNIYSLQQLIFKRVYGITYEQAQYISEKYGIYVDVCEEDFLEEDRDVLEILKAIDAIYLVDEECPDRDEKISSLVNDFYEYIKENGLYPDKDISNYILLRSMIDRIYMKTLNKDLYDASNKKVLYYHEGVPVIDAGLDFRMLVTVCGGVGDSYYLDFNYQKQYNSSQRSNNQGICCSYIGNENLGIISLSQPIVGYINLNDDALNAMGVGDIYSETTFLSLKEINGGIGEGKVFLTGNKLIDYTRFGYNELVMDRFLMHDKDNVLKVQPSYVVAYKIDENYMDTRNYERGLKMAKEFGIPLVLIDVIKIKENERKELLAMEEELFSSNEVNYELMEEIITRYMNNYTGSLTMIRSRERSGNDWKYYEDFSVRGLIQFLNKFEAKTNDLSIEELDEWYDALKECYELEEHKNEVANTISPYSYSIDGSEFLLDDEICFMDRVNSIIYNAKEKEKVRSGKTNLKKVCSHTRSTIPELDVIVDFANIICEGSYLKLKNNFETSIYQYDSVLELDEDVKNSYGILISYLLGDYSHNYFTDLETCDLTKIKFDYKKKDLVECLQASSVYKDHLEKTDELIDAAYRISSMRDDVFLDIFKPIMDKIVDNEILFEDGIEEALLRRKENMASVFNPLSYIPKKSKVKEK